MDTHDPPRELTDTQLAEARLRWWDECSWLERSLFLTIDRIWRETVVYRELERNVLERTRYEILEWARMRDHAVKVGRPVEGSWRWDVCDMQDALVAGSEIAMENDTYEKACDIAQLVAVKHKLDCGWKAAEAVAALNAILGYD
jgi:hypothetical protein